MGLFQASILDGKRCGTARAFLAPARGRRNLVVRSGVTVLRMTFDGARASGVDLLENGRPHHVQADAEVVLCAGAIGSPHLLLHSGIGPDDELAALGIRPQPDLPGVGLGLQDHKNCPITFATTQRFGIGHATADESAAHVREGADHGSGSLVADHSACGGFARIDPAAADPDLQRRRVVTGHRDHARYRSPVPGIAAFWLLQRPRSRGTVKLRNADPQAAPASESRYASDPDDADLALLVEGILLNREILRQSPIREVLGAERLFVADASVFPSMVSGNTNAPVARVAERAADFIRHRGTARARQPETTR